MLRRTAPTSSGSRTAGAAPVRRIAAIELEGAGDRLRAAGDRAGAERAYLSAVDAAAYEEPLILAALAIESGKLPAAEQVLRATLRRRPTSLAAIRLMALLAIQIGRQEDAVRLCDRALDLAPSFRPARELRARTLHRMNRFAEALADADALLADERANPSLAMLRAALLVRLGRQEEAADGYADTLARHPDNPTGWLSLGHVQKAIGRVDDAIATYRRALRSRERFGEAWWSLANLKTFRFDDDDIGAINRALADAADTGDRLHLHFALGKALEDRDECEQAFCHYARANALRRTQIDYRPEETTAFVDGMIEALSRWGAAAASVPDHAPAGPVFVVGLPRSGSTLVEQILSSHSAVEGTSELPGMMMIGERLKRRAEALGTAPADLIAALHADDRAALAREYLDHAALHRHSAKPMFIDKMPNNWLNLVLIHALFPHAPIIDVRRDPMAVGWATFKQHFASGQEFSYDQEHIALYYADYLRMLAAFAAAHPGRACTIVYERLVENTEGEVRTLLDRLGLLFEPDCLSFWRNTRVVRTPSSEQVRQPIYKSALDQWMKYDAWLHPMRATLEKAGVPIGGVFH